jgi:4-alpha-glucanotransferase
MIDPDLRYEDGLLSREVILAASCEGDACSVAFGELFLRREALLKVACARGYARDEAAVSAFIQENADWLPDYALYMAVKEHFNQRPFTEWEDDGIRLRKPEAMARYREELSDEVRFHIYTQYLFSRQWEALRAYCNARGISILGDIPIYVALDSSEYGRTLPYSNWTGTAAPPMWRACRRIISARRGSFGATRCITGSV